MNTNRWLDGLSIVYGRYIGLGINYWPDPNNRNANERSMSQSSDIARKGGFLQRPSIINWDFLCLSVMQQEENMFICLPSEHGWVDDGTFGKHLPPQPGKSHPSDRARGDKEDRARLQIRADNWHKNEEFAFIFDVFVAYTTQHTWVYTGGSSVSAQIGAVKAGKVNQRRAVNSVQASTSWAVQAPTSCAVQAPTSWAVQASTHAAQIIWAPIKRLSVQWVGGIALIFLERLFNI